MLATSSIFVAVIGLLLVAVNAAPSPVITSLIVSEETGRFLTVSANGQVTANGDISALEAHLLVHYISNNLIQIQSSTASEKLCYLTYEDGVFKGGDLDDGVSVFELVYIGDYNIALRPVTEDYDVVSDGDDVIVNDCFLGFSDAESEPRCYSSTAYAATRFTLFH